MKKPLTMIFLALFLLLSTGLVFGAEIAKEGSATAVTGFIATFQVLAHGKADLQMNYTSHGVVQAENEASPLYMSSVHCAGSLQAIKGEFKEMGLCTYTCPNGDQLFGSYEGTGQIGQSAKGPFTFVGGTGRWEGITGNGEWARTSLRPPAEGINASIAKFNYSWKLP